MDLKEILAISGYSGLYKFISQGRNGIIVESFADKKRTFISAATKVSSLNEIAIFTESEEVPLSDVFKAIFEMESGGKAPDPKSSNEELKSYMAKILPDYDKTRVYVSDIKKLVNWYNILLENELMVFNDDDEAKKEETPEIPVTKSSPEREKKTPAKNLSSAPKVTAKKAPAKKSQTMSQKKTG